MNIELVKKIIKEEVGTALSMVKSPLPEQTSDAHPFYSPVELDMDDKSKIKYGLISNIGESYRVTFDKKNPAKLKWNVQFIYRNYGIARIYPVIPDQKMSISYEIDGDTGYESMSKEIDVRDIQYELIIPENVGGSSGLIPYQIDFSNDKVTVLFTIGGV